MVADTYEGGLDIAKTRFVVGDPQIAEALRAAVTGAGMSATIEPDGTRTRVTIEHSADQRPGVENLIEIYRRIEAANGEWSPLDLIVRGPAEPEQ